MPITRRTLTARLRAILYGRVSRDQQGGRSVNQQLTTGRRRSVEHDWDVVGEYSDNDASASEYARKDRADWERVEADIAAGGVDLLWLWEISRGTRDLVVWAHLARTCQEQGVLIAIDDEVWDPTNPDHMKYLNTQMIDAVHEAGKTHKRLVRDAAAHAEEGGAHGMAGFGFRREYDPATGRLVRQVIDQGQAEVVRECARRYLAGEPLVRIAADLNHRRVPTALGYTVGDLMDQTRSGEPLTDNAGNPRRSAGWSYMTVRQMLERPAIMGKRGHHGRIIREGGWDGIISEEDWWAIRRRIDSNPGGKDTSVRHLLSGIVTCGRCGSNVGTTRRQRDDRRMYRCLGEYTGAVVGHVVRMEHILDAQVETLLAAEFAMPDVLERFRPADTSPEDVARAQAELERLRAELDELYADVAAGRTTRRMAQADEERLQRDIAALEPKARPVRVEPLAEDLADEDPNRVLETWRSWSLEQQRSALRAFTVSMEMMPVGQGRKKVSPTESVRITWVGSRGG
ncbi:DNA invertase Pin-like site-specific DNA recombinase [Lipingzhangella halophila]|uniref:DNA invertase Pin-like site-specific DNA recombinase n=1 Tax=Lipingzhangella halophila TaxID=1783352 RepID=A0A7W7RGX4_9ACTN|nr:recombinase family protein [Lipingzhangella halophila]MBB4931779.1 DNA invertase Pin-like site-specific DNA recombinase [Lipingzhangella halophila]